MEQYNFYFNRRCVQLRYGMIVFFGVDGGLVKHPLNITTHQKLGVGWYMIKHSKMFIYFACFHKDDHFSHRLKRKMLYCPIALHTVELRLLFLYRNCGWDEKLWSMSLWDHVGVDLILCGAIFWWSTALESCRGEIIWGVIRRRFGGLKLWSTGFERQSISGMKNTTCWQTWEILFWIIENGHFRAKLIRVDAFTALFGRSYRFSKMELVS